MELKVGDKGTLKSMGKGFPARVIATDAKGTQPVIILYEHEHGLVEGVTRVFKDGTCGPSLTFTKEREKKYARVDTHTAHRWITYPHPLTSTDLGHLVCEVGEDGKMILDTIKFLPRSAEEGRE